MKIKSVDIVGFRAYSNEGDGSFDFCREDGVVSDFISIYAPNGFGKSSLYDAMEWAITNNITRYIRDSQRVINDSASLHLNTVDSSQRILKNRYISNESPSYVVVKTTDKKEYHRTVRRPAVGQRDYTYDPNNTDKATKHLAEIFLSQDAIDAFLKEERPEQRYERFMKGFGEVDEKYRANLFSAIKSCGRDIKSIQDSISSLEEALEEPSLDFSVEQVNNTIGEINALGGGLALIGTDFSDLNQAELRSKLSKRVVELETKIASLEKLVGVVDLTVEGLPRLIQLRSSREALRTNIQALRVNKEKLDELSRAHGHEADLTVRLQGIMLEIEHVDWALSKLDEISRLIDQISLDEADVQSISSSIDSATVSYNALLQSIEFLRNQRVELDAELAALLDDASKADARYQEIHQVESLISGYQSKISDLEGQRSATSALSQSLKDEYSSYFNLEVGKFFVSQEVQAFLKPDPQFIANFHQHLELKDDAERQLLALQQRAKDLGAQSEDLFSLLSLANSLLSQSFSDECPVCNAKYESHTALLARIQSNGSIESALNSILEATEKAKSKLAQYDEFLDKGHVYLKELKNTNLSGLTARATSADEEMDQLSRAISDVHRESALKTDILNRLKASVRNLANVEYYQLIQSAIATTNDNIKVIATKLDVAINAARAAKEGIEKLVVEKSTRQTRIEVLQGSDIYTNFSSLRLAYAISESEIFSGFSDKHNELTVHRGSTIAEISTIEFAIAEIKLGIAEKGYPTEELVNDRLSSLTDEIGNIEDSISKMEANLRALVSDPGSALSELSKALSTKKEVLEEQRKSLDSDLLLTKILKAQLDNVLPFFKYQRARDEIGQKINALKKLERLSLSLSKELREIEVKLKQRIDKFFYTELITSIYRKIDPHPFFKTVSFECVFPEGERPRLEVYLYEAGSPQPISPGLYFSSAQLNILSLSIFLAKALHVQYEGKPVRAILIDDPIHSMDSINVLSVIDLLRNISVKFDRQIILSTHDENFYELLKLKVPEDNFGSKFIRLKSFGVVQGDARKAS